MSLLLGVASTFPLAFTLVYAVGFVAAVGIGSIAWYNSKRPPGWEDNDRPLPQPNASQQSHNLTY